MKNSQRKQTASSKTKKAVAKTPLAASPGASFPLKRILLYGCLAAVLLFVFFVRQRLLPFPLERDEGEYALMGQLILKGIPPYEMAYNMKLPGTYYMYALVMFLFGESTTGIHTGLLVVNLASILLLFAVGKKLVNETVAIVAAASYALLSLAPGALGFAAHATHFNVLTGLGGLLLLLSYFDRPTFVRLAGSGFCFGLSFVMKQHAVFLMMFGLVALVLFEKKRTPQNLKDSALKLAVFCFALVLPYLLIVLVAVLTGSFDKFWHWTVEYAGQYAGMTTLARAWVLLKSNFEVVSKGMVLFWLTGLAGLAALFFHPPARKHFWTILLFVLFSMMCVMPGLYFRHHYFIVFFPALALLVGIALDYLRQLLLQRGLARLSLLPFLFFALMVFLGIKKHALFFFKGSPDMLCSMVYGSANPFQESVEIAKFIRANSKAGDKVAVIGSEPQICFYSDRLPATGYIYTYPLMENQAYSLSMQREMIAEIERSQPKYLIYVDSPFSWLRRSDSQEDIFVWYQHYRENYKLVGLVDMNPSRKATYAWREALNGYSGKGQSRVWVYERE